MDRPIDLRRSDRRVLREMRRRAENDVAAVSQRDLSAATGYCPRTVQAALLRMRDAGVVRVARYGRPISYHLPPEMGE